MIRRRNNTEIKDWDEVLDRFHKSGLSGALFAAREGIPHHNLRYRLRLARAAQKPVPATPSEGFVEVHPSPAPSPSPAPAPISQPKTTASLPPKVSAAPALRLHLGALCLEFGALPTPEYGGHDIDRKSAIR